MAQRSSPKGQPTLGAADAKSNILYLRPPLLRGPLYLNFRARFQLMSRSKRRNQNQAKNATPPL